MDEQALEIAGAMLLWLVVAGLSLSLYLAEVTGARRARRRPRSQRAVVAAGAPDPHAFEGGVQREKLGRLRYRARQ